MLIFRQALKKFEKKYMKCFENEEMMPYMKTTLFKFYKILLVFFWQNLGPEEIKAVDVGLLTLLKTHLPLEPSKLNLRHETSF